MDDKGGIFEINQSTGDVFITKAVDYETTQSYTIELTASDWKFSTKVEALITIINENDNYPIFNPVQYQTTVPESLTSGTGVLTVTASDLDSFGKLKYTLETDIPSLPFDVDVDTGKIIVAGKLDRETKDSYSFNVTATDNGNPTQLTGKATVRITISDVNDNFPQFSNDSIIVEVMENKAAGSIISKVTATDQDLGNNATIRYQSFPPSSSLDVNFKNGLITTKRPFDREKETKIEFTLQAIDLGTPNQKKSKPFKIIVNVLDENDNSPIWDKHNYTASIPEDETDEFINVLARDLDDGENGKVSYSIEETDSNFTIKSRSGNLCLFVCL